MSYFLKQISKSFFYYNSGSQISVGIVAGLLIGLLPKLTLPVLLLVFAVLLLRINAVSAFATAFFISLLNPLFDKITDPVGTAVLTASFLKPFFVFCYNVPLLPWTFFNNSSVMGGFLLWAALAVPLYFSARRLINRISAAKGR